jgi:hypothetical protein
MLAGAACADHHMSIDDVGCPARRQQPADVRRIHPVEVHNVSRRLTNQAGQPDLPLRPPDRLGQRGRRNRDAGTRFPRAGQQDHYAAGTGRARMRAPSGRTYAVTPTSYPE